jgi:hypothetical protein
MLETYVVKVENILIGKQLKMLNYLTNENHENHNNGKTEIYTLGEETIHLEDIKEDYLESLGQKLYTNSLNYMKKGVGGKPLKRIAKSISFNIPPKYEPNMDQIKLIMVNLMDKLQDYINAHNIALQPQDIFMNIHKQKNSHINFILPTLDNNGMNIRKFNTPYFVKHLKQIFTEVVDQELKQDINQYVSQTPEELKHSRLIYNMRELVLYYKNLRKTPLHSKLDSFIKNQITVIERVLTDKTFENEIEMNKINEQIQKINAGVHNDLDIKIINDNELIEYNNPKKGSPTI